MGGGILLDRVCDGVELWGLGWYQRRYLEVYRGEVLCWGGGGGSRTRWVRGGFGIREEGKGEGYWSWDWRIEYGDGVR